MKKITFSIVFFLSMALASGTLFAFASRPPQCVTYGKAKEYREYQNRCDQMMIDRWLAANPDADEERKTNYLGAFQPGIDQRNAWLAFYATQNQSATAQPCVYAFPNYDYTKDCR